MNRFYDFFNRHKLGRLINRETVSYLFWGVVTTILNIGLFQLLLLAGMPYRWANILTLIVVKIAAYLANKFFVFHSRSKNFGALLREILRYVIVRGGTMLVDYFGLILLVDLAGFPPMLGKVITTVVVVILNYILGKFGVFRDARPARAADDAIAPSNPPEEEAKP